MFLPNPVTGRRGGFFRSLLLALVLVLGFQQASAQVDGKALFQANCASCHNPLKDATGPALKGVDGRVPNKEWLHKWVHNPSGVIASGDKYAVDLFNKWNKTQMTAFPQLSTDEIDAIISYVNSVEDKKAAPTGTSNAGDANANAGANSWIYTAITVLLLLAVWVMWRANKSLKRAAAEKVAVPTTKEVPFWRNKITITLLTIVVISFAGYWLVNGAVNLGRQTNYMPKQPIFYSHKVHAGINQINCLYCHSAAEKSRHAMIPSTNVCMNCHKQINQYTGAEEHPLVTAEGKTVNGTAEIQKLYEYAGWNTDKKDYNRDAAGNILAKSPEWVKIHNLPDHVYFNHSQHVAVGKIPCQQCHGNVEEMDEVYQMAPLSMGWCINCHRQTSVQFANNNYYQIYEKYHQEFKEGKRDKVTVEDIGGIECQKCHY